MKEVVHKLYAIKNTPKESLKAKRNFFYMQIQRVAGKIKEIEMILVRLEIKIGFLKAKEQMLGHQLGKNIPAIKKNKAQPKK